MCLLIETYYMLLLLLFSLFKIKQFYIRFQLSLKNVTFYEIENLIDDIYREHRKY